MKIKFPAFPLGLRRPTPKRHRQLRGSVSTPESGFGRREWVLSRPLYHFARFELKSVPRAQRPQALQLQIRQWAPFVRANSYLLWEQDSALVWAWDADAVDAAMTASGLRSRGITVIPETLLQQRRTNGTFLVTCLEGCEGQAWREGVLTVSRWWSAPPGENAWLSFQRDAGISPGDQSPRVPAPEPLQLAERPWSKSEALDKAAEYGVKGEQWMLPAAALGLFVCSVWYGAQVVKLRMGVSERNAELQSLNARAEPVMAARGQALDALARIRSLHAALDRYPDQVNLMAKVAEALPADGTYLTEWEFQNGRLKLQIASANKLASSDYIKRLEAAGVFENVQATPASSATGLALTMDVLPRAAFEVALNAKRPDR